LILNKSKTIVILVNSNTTTSTNRSMTQSHTVMSHAPMATDT